MYLKRIDLAGFKSFPSKTKLSFEPGICCVVGPNGSGKSNVSDALRWVLGEQSARNIRGSKLEDVIFSGSKARRSLSRAEVSVILDNSDGYLPLPYSEVCVTRRAVRGEAGEYYINEQPCRLKDIRDLFCDSGIGTEGLSLINQGRVHELMEARPDERRALVEEAAGIIKYRDRKREAVRKLAETEQALLRVGDIIGELEERLLPLSLQAEKAQKYLGLKQESDQLEIGISVRVLSEADEKIAALTEQWEAATHTLLEKETARLSLAAEAVELKLKLAGVDEAVSAASAAYYQLQTEREKAEGEKRLAETQRESSAAAATRLQKELDALTEALTSKQSAAEALAAEILAAEAMLLEQEQLLFSEQGDDGDLLEAVAFAQEKLAAGREGELTRAAALAAAENRRDMQREHAEHSRSALAVLLAERDQLTAEITASREEQTQLEAKLAKLTKESKEQTGLLNAQSAQIQQLNQAAQDLAADEAECRLRVHSAETRVTMLKEMAEGYEGFFPGVRGVMAAHRKGSAPAGILGVIAELMEVPERFRVAIEAYLGANIQNIVCQDAAAAKSCIAWLKEKNLGRATFLPLDILKVREAADFRATEALPGAFGRASELIAAAPHLRPAVDFLLNNLLVVADMDTALAAAKALHYRSSVVTLEGDLVNPGASISGGSRNAKAGELLGKQSKLREAEQALAALQKELAGISEKRTVARGALHTAQEKEDALREQLRALSLALADGTREKEQAAYKQESLAARVAALKEQTARAESELADMAEEAAEAEEEAARLLQEQEEALTALAALAAELAAVETRVASAREAVTEKKVQLASSQEKIRGQQSALSLLQTTINDLGWEAEEKAADLKEALASLENWQQESEKVEEQRKSLGLALLAAEEKLEAVRHGYAAESARLDELARAEKAMLSEENSIKDTVHHIEIRRARWQADFENEAARLAERFALDLPTATAQLGEIPARTVMIAQLSQVRREIDALGNINLDAIEEHQAVRSRYTFLSEQRADMCLARERLDQVIAEMDQIMTSRFRTAFGKLSDAFDVSFRRLFGGGSAKLVMSEPTDVLATGVELVISLPGKKVSNYNLLSGGEKSLVGIALIFAMLAVRPTPFCVMDEVDAALDEANISRFTDYLRDEADRSQFIMISHRQTTMEAASLLWGITMEEEGVSKVVGVRI